MILVDDREGSEPLYHNLVKAGLPAELTRLEFGDLYFVGRGIGGAPLSIGIEFKTLQECVTSLRTGRLQGHQLLGMRGASPDEVPLFDHCYLLIEGETVYDAKGRLMRRTSARTAKPLGMTVAEFYKRLFVLHLCGGLNWHVAETRRDSVQWISALYHTWTDTDLDKHKSHLAIYTPPALVPLSQFRQTVGTLPGVARAFSQGAETKFGSIYRAITASTEEWASVESTDGDGKTRRLGTSNAQKVREAIHATGVR